MRAGTFGPIVAAHANPGARASGPISATPVGGLLSANFDCLTPNGFQRLDEQCERGGKVPLLLCTQVLERVAEIDTRPALVPGLRFEALADRLLEEQQVVGDILQQAKVASGIACLEVQRQLDPGTAVVQPQLEMDGRGLLPNPLPVKRRSALP
jgi:hypothetical protein